MQQKISHAPNTFIEAVILAKTTGDFGPVWAAFVETDFFAFVHPISPIENGQIGDFRFHVVTSGNGEMVTAVSTLLVHRSSMPESAIKLKGSSLISMLNPDVGIIIFLNIDGEEEDVLGMPAGLVGQLRASLIPTV